MSATAILDPRSYAYHEDPYGAYRHLRDEAPLWRNEELGFWAVSRYDDVASVATDWRTFISGAGVTLRGPHRPPQMISQDPPRHQVLRTLVRSAFTARKVATLEADVAALCRTLLDRVTGRARFDCISDYSELVPTSVIAWVLGVDEEGSAAFHQLMNRYMHRAPGTSEPGADGRAAETDALRWVASVIDDPDARSAGSLVGTIAGAVRRETISRDEAVGMVFQLLIAGFETTKKLVGTAVVQLWRHPGQRALLAQRPDLVANAVEETLRFDGPTPHMFRTASTAVSLHGQTIEPGERVMLLFASANRDERRWPEADRYDVQRDTRGHFGFGHGIHLCLGAALARLESRIALEVFLDRYPEYAVDDRGTERSHNDNNRGYDHVSVVV